MADEKTDDENPESEAPAAADPAPAAADPAPAAPASPPAPESSPEGPAEDPAQSYGRLATMIALVSFAGGPLLAFVFSDDFGMGSIALWTILMLSGLVVVVFVLPGIMGMSNRVTHVIQQVNSADIITQPQMRTLQTAAAKQAKAKMKSARTSTSDLIKDEEHLPTIAFDGRELVVAKDPSRHTEAWIPLPKMLVANIRGVRGKLLGTYGCVAAIYVDGRTPLANLAMPLEDVADRAIDTLEHTFDVATAPLSHLEIATILLDSVQRALGFTTVVNLAVSKGKIEEGQGEERRFD